MRTPKPFKWIRILMRRRDITEADRREKEAARRQEVEKRVAKARLNAMENFLRLEELKKEGGRWRPRSLP